MLYMAPWWSFAAVRRSYTRAAAQPHSPGRADQTKLERLCSAGSMYLSVRGRVVSQIALVTYG